MEGPSAREVVFVPRAIDEETHIDQLTNKITPNSPAQTGARRRVSSPYSSTTLPPPSVPLAMEQPTDVDGTSFAELPVTTAD